MPRVNTIFGKTCSSFLLVAALTGCGATSPPAPLDTAAAATPTPAQATSHIPASAAPVAASSAPGAQPAAEAKPVTTPKPPQPPPQPRVKQVASGGRHSCALLENNALFCWGAGTEGQLGAGRKDSPTPVEVKGLGDVQAMALGDSHSCVLLASGAINCWGKIPPSDQITPPTLIEGLKDVTAMAAGASFHCVQRANDIGKVRCWGYNKKHQLCDGSSINRAKPMAIPSLFRVTHMALGNRHGCVHRKGAVECFGANGHGQVVGLLAPRPTRSVVGGVQKSDFLSAGDHHSCSASAKRVQCWGSNLDGALAHKDPKQRGPVVIPLDAARKGEDVLQLVSGAKHSCIRTASKILCWGSNSAGQIGDGSLVPIAIESASSITAGGSFGCAIAAKNGRLHCWGANDHGQLGQPRNMTHSQKPVPINF